MVLTGEKKNASRVLVGKPEEKSSLKRSGCTWEGNIKVDINEIGWEDVDWTDLTQMRDKRQAAVNSVLNLWVTQCANNCWLADELSTFQEQFCSRELVGGSVGLIILHRLVCYMPSRHRGEVAGGGIPLPPLDFGARRVWVGNTTPWQLYLQEGDWVFILQEAGWASGPVCMGTKNFAPPPPVFIPQTVHLVAIHYTDWAILAP